MAETYKDLQLQRFDQTARVVHGGFTPSTRIGRIIGAGNKASTETAGFWNVELLSHEFKRIDINFADRFATGAAVYNALTNVASAVSSSYASGDIVTIQIPDSVGNGGFGGYLDAVGGFYYMPGNKCTIMAGSGGGASTCAIGVNTFGPHFG